MRKHHLRPSPERLLYQYKLRYDYLCLKDFSHRAIHKLQRILEKKDA